MGNNGENLGRNVNKETFDFSALKELILPTSQIEGCITSENW
jgi:hypothetical protein